MDAKSTIQWASPVSVNLIVGLALAVVVGYVVLRWLSGRPIALARSAVLFVLRALVLAVVAVILLNPMRVDETPGPVERPKVFYLVDTSQSMALGKGMSRWTEVVKTIGKSEAERDPRLSAQVSVFRFGSRLAGVESPFWLPRQGPRPVERGGQGEAFAAPASRPPEPPPAPTDSDTLLTSALEGLTGRFGQTPPQAVVVFSDGRARDPDRSNTIARAYKQMKIPIHVLPVGDSDVGGDVAIVSMVAPTQVRKYSQVPVQLFVRSYGYKGWRTELKLVSVAPDGSAGAVLARTPIVLKDGVASYSLVFESGDQDRRIEARIESQPGEVSSSNNAFGSDLTIDHTKIRVLYLEGATDRYVAAQVAQPAFGNQIRGAYSALQEALMEDPDIECTAVMPGGFGGDFSSLVRTDERGRGLPETPSELYAYDAIILSNVPSESLSEKHLEWVDEWIGRRGGGLCMVGGPNSFSSGHWFDTTVGRMLPWEIAPSGRDWDEVLTTSRPVTDRTLHPIWHIASDDAQNRALLKTLPTFLGSNRAFQVKPGAEVLARSNLGGPGVAESPAIAAQPYGRGRTMAMTFPITRRWASEFTQSWGQGDARYYKKFWRNVIYWLTENSSIGRRRLLAETDKRLYRPGEPIVLRARTFDENAAPTLDYRVAVSVEPKSASDVTSDDSPLRRPAGAAKPSEGQGPLLPWGDEFDLTRQPAESSYTSSLAIADAKSLPTGVALTQGLRIELTAYENNTQVDSTALEVQVLDDPSEQQNPIPDHDLLRRIAKQTGGKVLQSATDLSGVLSRLPVTVGAPEIKKVPAWSRWWLLTLLLVLLTIEWIWRRRIGLA